MTLPSIDQQLDTIHAWAHELEALAQRSAPRFARTEARYRMQAYLQGLLSNVERKNGWQLAQNRGNSTPYGLQHLLGRARWDADQVRDDLQHYVIEQLAEPQGVLIVDETGFIKKGDKSCGVARQYSGTAGRIENCQVGVFLCYAGAKGHAFLDRQLYLPKEWTDDKARCREAGVPDGIAFKTKPKIARALLQRAFDAGVSARFVTADCIYGNDRSLQIWLELRKQAYVLSVTGQESVWIGGEQYRVKALVAGIPEDAWQVLPAGEGAKGPRLYAWAWHPLNCLDAPKWRRWILVRRSLSDGGDLRAFVAFAPSDTTLSDLVQGAGMRWSIEVGFESAKGDVGLDHYEVRSWHGWHRHVTLCLLAHAFLASVRASTPDLSVKRGLCPLPAVNSLRAFKLSRGLSCP